MREAMVICPQHDNDGRSLQHVKHYTELSLCKAFGGCTTSQAKGSWIDPQGKLIAEPVWCLTSACEHNAASERTLRSLARYIGTEGNQTAVYVRFADGSVEIIPTAAEALPHAA